MQELWQISMANHPLFKDSKDEGICLLIIDMCCQKPLSPFGFGFLEKVERRHGSTNGLDEVTFTIQSILSSHQQLSAKGQVVEKTLDPGRIRV